MRRSFAAALLGLSLWIGALAWSGFVMMRTVLDPGRSLDVAEALLDDESVRDQLVQNIAGGIESGLPDGARVDQATLEAGAEQALDSPEVQALVLAAFVRSHRAFLGEDEAPEAIDGAAFGSAAPQSVVDARPELEGLLPDAPMFEVPLPTERIPNVGPVRRGLVTAVTAMAALATIGAGLALLVTTDRPGVIRRAGFWAIGLSAFVLVFAYGVPALARQVAPAQAEVVAALVGALAATTRWPAAALAAAGLAGIIVSLVWRRTAAGAHRVPGAHIASRRPPRRSGPALGGRPRRDLPVPGRRPSSTHRTDQLPVTPAGRPGHSPSASLARAHRPGPDATRVEPAVASGGARPTREDARWVEGVGWVHEGTGAIPEGARWVPGVGYVLDD